MLPKKELSHRINEYAKLHLDGIPYKSRQMTYEVVNCLSAGCYPIYIYELKFIKGSEKQTLVEITIPNCPTLENLISCIQHSGKYGDIALKVCKDKYNSRDPFKVDKRCNAYDIIFQYSNPHMTMGDKEMVKQFNHVRVSQIQCTITEIPGIMDYIYKLDWKIIIPGVYPEPPVKPNYFVPGEGYKITGYEISEELIKQNLSHEKGE